MKNRSQGDDAGLSLVPKLKYEHLHLTSYSKMRVDLAAQVRVTCTVFNYMNVYGLHASLVLSNSVSKALILAVGPKATQISRFAEMFNKFFDCLNVSSLSAGKFSRNPFRSPYRSGTDWKLKVCFH